jgi:hypothetical protein
LRRFIGGETSLATPQNDIVRADKDFSPLCRKLLLPKQQFGQVDSAVGNKHHIAAVQTNHPRAVTLDVARYSKKASASASGYCFPSLTATQSAVIAFSARTGGDAADTESFVPWSEHFASHPSRKKLEKDGRPPHGERPALRVRSAAVTLGVRFSRFLPSVGMTRMSRNDKNRDRAWNDKRKKGNGPETFDQ